MVIRSMYGVNKMKTDIFVSEKFASTQNFHIKKKAYEAKFYPNYYTLTFTLSGESIELSDETILELEDLLSEYRRAREEHNNSISEV